MVNTKINFILKENKGTKDINGARYVLSYHINNSEDIKKLLSFNILSSLKGDRDVLVEVKSSLLNLSNNVREKCSIDFLNSVKKLGLSFRSRKVVEKNRSFLSNILNFGMNDKESSEILVFIPKSLWNNKEFYTILPKYGIRYYIFKNTGENIKLLDDMFNGQIFEDNLLEIFSLIIYDCSSFCQMGINTNVLSYNELKNLISKAL